MKLKTFLFFIFTLLIGFLFIQCPAQGSGSGGSGGGGSNSGSPSSSSPYTALGVYDTAFNSSGAGADNSVYAAVTQTDGKILVGGDFTQYNNKNIPNRIIRLNSDGSIDSTFNNGGTGADNTIYTIALKSDNNILIGGFFTTFNGVNVPDGIIKLDEKGKIDSTFNTGGDGTNGTVYDIIIQTNGKILIGGDFTIYNGVSVPWGILRLNEDGTIDTTFNNGGSGANSVVNQIAIQPDGKILIRGAFTAYNSVNVPSGIIRLNSDGSADTTFNNGGTGLDLLFNNNMTLQSDGKVLVGGVFNSYNGIDVPDSIIRLNTDGTIDATFNNGGSGANNGVNSIAVQSDGKILIGGGSTAYNGNTVSRGIIRLNSNGTVDATFNDSGIGTDSDILTIALQSNNLILIGGIFTTYNGENTPDNIIRLK